MKTKTAIAALLIFAGFFLWHPVVIQRSLAQNSETQEKLDALEDAYKAGILSEGEYLQKKAEIEASVPQISEETQKKLEALDAARSAGILSDEEYERKKAELLGAQKTTADAMTGIGLSQYSDPQGRFQFKYPPDWEVQQLDEGTGIAITRGNAALSVMPLPDGISPGAVFSIAEQIGQQWSEYQELGRGQKKIGGQDCPMVDFSGVNTEGMRAHGQVTVFVSNGKGFLFILIAPEEEPANSFGSIEPVWNTLLTTFSLAANVPTTGNVFRHASGFSFSYPEGWSVADQDGFLQLTPPGTQATADATAELYFIAMVENMSQEGIQRPDDPMVLQYLDEQVMTLSPAFAREGEPSPVKMQSGQGIVANWGAEGTEGEARAWAFVAIINDYALILIGMGVKENVEARDADMRGIFSSFGFGQLQQTATASDASGHAGNQQQIGATASADIGAGEAGDQNWGFKFKPPAGWKFQKTNEYILLGHDTIAGMVFVLPHMVASLQELQAEMQSGLTDEGVNLLPSGAIQPIGNNAFGGEFSGILQGQQVKARGIGTFSPHGGGGA